MTKFLGTIVGKIVAAVILLVIVLLALKMFTGVFSAKQVDRVRKGQAEASIDSGAEATNTVADLLNRDAQTRAIVTEGLEAIRNAPEAEKDDAAVRALCRLELYAATPRCVALRSE